MDKWPLRRRMVAEWGLEIDDVFVPMSLLGELAEQGTWDSQFGDAFLIDNPAIGEVLERHGLAFKETRGGYHRGENLPALLALYTSEDMKTQEDQLFAALVDLHLKAGAPSTRAMAQGIGGISHTTVHNVLSGTKLPSWPVVQKIITYLGGNPADFTQMWKDSHSSKKVSRKRTK